MSIEVVVLNEQDYEFVFHKGWHIHKGEVCDKCIVMAVF